MNIRQPTQKPTPMEWQVIAYVFIVGLAVTGIVFFGVSAKLSPEKPDVAREVFQLGWYCIGGSALALLLWQGMRRLF